MEHFFRLHSENIIGYKALTKADLGLSETSHQTHIGLFEDILHFLPNDMIVDENAMFIYNNNVEFLPLYFNRIKGKKGFRSAKIISGEDNTISILKIIRTIVKTDEKNHIWFLFWFGLENEQAVFFLFNNDSQEFLDITNIGLSLDDKKKGRITNNDSRFNKLLSYIENKVDISTQNILKELEIETQIPGKLITEKKIRKYDIKKAQDLFTKIGKQGEEFVAEYFDRLKFNRIIKSYNWVNESSESGNPFDFSYQDLSDNVIYLDVKTTKFDFEQKIIYSDKEINFALEQASNCYNIYRVYNLTDNNADLRICKDCFSHFNSINNNILNFQNNLKGIETNTHAINIAFQPNIKYLNFDNQITLTKNSL